MTDHDPAHEDLIERWLAGEIADDAAEWRALMDAGVVIAAVVLRSRRPGG